MQATSDYKSDRVRRDKQLSREQKSAVVRGDERARVYEFLSSHFRIKSRKERHGRRENPYSSVSNGVHKSDDGGAVSIMKNYHEVSDRAVYVCMFFILIFDS